MPAPLQQPPISPISTPIAADFDRAELDAITHDIIGAAQTVSSILGSGFLEKVYENALCLELRARGLRFEQQPTVPVRYKGQIVGEYVPDLLVEERIVVELKAVHMTERVHHAQCVHYLRATSYRVCLLFNFGTASLSVRRIVNRF